MHLRTLVFSLAHVTRRHHRESALNPLVRSLSFSPCPRRTPVSRLSSPSESSRDLGRSRPRAARRRAEGNPRVGIPTVVVVVVVERRPTPPPPNCHARYKYTRARRFFTGVPCPRGASIRTTNTTKKKRKKKTTRSYRAVREQLQRDKLDATITAARWNGS